MKIVKAIWRLYPWSSRLLCAFGSIEIKSFLKVIKHPNPTEVLLTSQSLMKRYKQHQQHASMPIPSRSTRNQNQFPKDWQLIILIVVVGAKNKQWHGIAFIWKNRQGHVHFVGCQSLWIGDSTMAKVTAIREASLQVSIQGFRNCIIFTNTKGK